MTKIDLLIRWAKIRAWLCASQIWISRTGCWCSECWQNQTPCVNDCTHNQLFFSLHQLQRSRTTSGLKYKGFGVKYLNLKLVAHQLGQWQVVKLSVRSDKVIEISPGSTLAFTLWYGRSLCLIKSVYVDFVNEHLFIFSVDFYSCYF